MRRASMLAMFKEAVAGEKTPMLADLDPAPPMTESPGRGCHAERVEKPPSADALKRPEAVVDGQSRGAA